MPILISSSITTVTGCGQCRWILRMAIYRQALRSTFILNDVNDKNNESFWIQNFVFCWSFFTITTDTILMSEPRVWTDHFFSKQIYFVYVVNYKLQVVTCFKTTWVTRSDARPVLTQASHHTSSPKRSEAPGVNALNLLRVLIVLLLFFASRRGKPSECMVSNKKKHQQ